MLNDTDFERRFWSRVEIGPGCWEWRRRRNHDGYGCIHWGNRQHRAHRIAWLLVYRKPPKDIVCHRCDNPACCRPSHLFEGTHQDNVADRVAKGRQGHPSGERNGNAKLTIEDVQQIRALSGTIYQKDIAAMFGVDQTTISG